MIINKYPTTGRMINWQIKPTKNSFGFWNTLVKSFTVSDAPKDNIINANANGAIVVTIPMTPLNKLSPQMITYKKIKKLQEDLKPYE